MGEPNHIEDKLRDKLNSREFVIKDSWQTDMDARLDAFNGSKKGGFLFWLLGGFIFLGVAGGIAFYMHSTSTLKNQNTSALTAHDSILNHKNNRTVEIEKGSASSEELLTENEKGTSIETEYSDQTDSPEHLLKNGEDFSSHSGNYISDPAPNKDDSKTKDDSLTKLNGQSESNEESTKLTEPNEKAAEENGSRKTKENFNSIPDSSTAENEPSDEKGKTTYKNQSSTKGSEFEKPGKLSPTEAQANGSGNSLMNEDSENENDSSSSKSKKLDSVDQTFTRLSKMNLKYALLPFSDGRRDVTFNSKQELFIPDVKKMSKWELSLMAGLGISKLDNQAFIDGQNSFGGGQLFSNITSSQIDLRLKRSLGANLSISSGLSKTTLGEEIQYEDFLKLTETITYDTFQITELFVDSIFDVNDSLISIDSTFITTIDSLEVLTVDSLFVNIPDEANGKKTFHYLEIPLGIQYSISLGNKSRILLAPEVALGILTTQTGSYFDNALTASTSKSMYVSGSMGLGYSYAASEKLYLSGMVRLRKPFGNQSEAGTPVRNYTHYSFTFGVGYRF